MLSSVSVIIPVLNEKTNIQVLLHQLNGSGAEVIVVDGGSTDGSLETIKGFQIKVIESAPGRSTQMNAGATLATGDILLFLHADTRVPDTWQSDLEGIAETDAKWGRFDIRFDSVHPMLVLIALTMNLRSRLSSVCTGDQAMFVRRDTFARLGGFADIPLMEDIEISKRLRSISAPCCLDSKVTTSSWRWQANGIWRTILLMWWLRLQYFFGVSPARLVKQYYS